MSIAYDVSLGPLLYTFDRTLIGDGRIAVLPLFWLIHHFTEHTENKLHWWRTTVRWESEET